MCLDTPSGKSSSGWSVQFQALAMSHFVSEGMF